MHFGCGGAQGGGVSARMDEFRLFGIVSKTVEGFKGLGGGWMSHTSRGCVILTVMRVS